MKKIYIQLLVVGLVLITADSCSREVVGYIEVRNQLDKEINNVSWGNSINLGAIKPGEEAGEETDLFGDHYITYEYEGEKYRSRDLIEVDSHTSATLIIEDLNDAPL